MPHDSTCSVPSCESLVGSHGGRGWCSMHYKRWKRNGGPEVVILKRGGDPSERFWDKVSRAGPEECWPWTGTLGGSNGYGAFWLDGHQVPAHRYSLALSGIEIPPGMIVMHSCDNPPCVNPAHLSVGTNADNTADMFAKGRQGTRPQTHCNRGHEFTPENTKIEASGSQRCRTCQREYQRSRAGLSKLAPRPAKVVPRPYELMDQPQTLNVVTED